MIQNITQEFTPPSPVNRRAAEVRITPRELRKLRTRIKKLSDRIEEVKQMLNKQEPLSISKNEAFAFVKQARKSTKY